MAILKKRMAILLAVGILTGCSSTDAVPTSTTSIFVETSLVSSGQVVLSDSFIGTITPKETTYIFPMMAGITKQVNIEVGDVVSEGDILFTLDDESQQMSLDQAQATYAQAEAGKAQALLMANLELDNTLASYDQLALARAQSVIQAQNTINNTNASYDQLILAKEQALIQTTNSIDNTNLSYDQLVLAKEQALIQAKNTVEDAEVAYKQLIASRDQSVGSSVDMQLIELEMQMDAIKLNIETTKIQLEQAGGSLDGLADSVSDAKSDYNSAKSDANSASNKANSAYDNYIDAQYKASTANVLAAEYSMIQMTSTTLAGLTIQQAANNGTSNGVPAETANAVQSIYSQMTSAGISGLSSSEVSRLETQASDALSTYTSAQSESVSASANEATTELMYNYLDSSYDSAETEIENAEEIAYATIAGLEANLRNMEEIYNALQSTTTEEILEIYDAQIERAELGIRQATEALDMITDSYDTQIAAVVLGLNQANQALGMTSDSYDSQIASAQLGLNQANQALGMTTDSYDEQMKQLDIAISGTQSNLPLIESVYNAQLSAANVGVASAQYVLDKLVITSPTSGIVDQVNVTEDVPVSNAEVAVVVADYSQMETSFFVSKDVRATFEEGQQVVVEYEGKQYFGEISDIASSVNPQTSLFQIKALIDVDYGDIPSGSVATIYTTTQKSNTEVVIPYSSVYFEKGQSFVYVVKDGIAYKQLVETGLFDAETIVITNGIDIGDKIVTTWSSQLRDGVLVEEGE
ncbi:MAG: hypothetical protein ATN35_01245 [Epulopiscium sp. Nele67-Bin004]|nr:MAG: hypothetical protein ATN35_01245 [Epulopiscium sp. Nele67-Bin004]